jgi:hypothetical protein
VWFGYFAATKRTALLLTSELKSGLENLNEEVMSRVQRKRLGVENHNKEITHQMQRKAFGIEIHNKEITSQLQMETFDIEKDCPSTRRHVKQNREDIS